MILNVTVVCGSYNPPAHDVHIMAKTMLEHFTSIWEPQEAAIMENWRIGEKNVHRDSDNVCLRHLRVENACWLLVS